MSKSTLEVLRALADWSPWVPFAAARETAPRLPGVYLAREGADGELVYVGMAGERSGAGIRGRLTRYASGKAIASGLGEAAFDRALADPAWLRMRLAEAEAGRPKRAAQWGKLALEHADLHLCWSVTADELAARALEQTIIGTLQAHSGLWNRRR
ncbi:hypothetical protein [Amycolatopsis dendrobii]|uniref:GIY-YIG domain-containing protein n=1 Tax=Amycolatopsis dendrobii TaxID=2760662 RepID=A0A7W3Z989_9PSEU|nr:hypothetical protein [Amycolatopsis dendrobii]MBB1152504.1 hypothetical protein [Amycolatopsis dendrobii]